MAGRIRGLRWWLIGLVMAGTALNYLTRSVLGVAVAISPMMADIGMTTEQYGWVTGIFQAGIMFQPLAGYILDLIGLRIGLAAFAAAWGGLTMMHGLANGWPALAGLRGALGFAEGTSHPGGLKVVAEYFPARERGFATGIYNIGASFGGILAPPLVGFSVWMWSWRAAFLIAGGLALAWALAWRSTYRPRADHPALGAEERAHIEAGQEAHLAGAAEGVRPSPRAILRQRNFWGIALPRFLADPMWGMLTFWMPLYLRTERGFDLAGIVLFSWLPFVAADAGCLFGPAVAAALQRRGVALIPARKLTFALGAAMMAGMLFVARVESPVAAIALLSLGAFAHQTLSITCIATSSDLFRKHELGTVAGSAGLLANLGVLLSSLAIGHWVGQWGYEPFFVAVFVCDLLAAVVLWSFVRAPAEQ
ncbi:MAG: MFS transporter [Sphingomonadaceae bacterium]|nr:MFS transporter [Sphingomonadaceae bacterium]